MMTFITHYALYYLSVSLFADHKQVHFRIKRWSVADLPKEDAAISQWLLDVFDSDFEKPLSEFEAKKAFSDVPKMQMARPYKTLVLFAAQVRDVCNGTACRCD